MADKIDTTLIDRHRDREYGERIDRVLTALLAWRGAIILAMSKNISNNAELDSLQIEMAHCAELLAALRDPNGGTLGDLPASR
jgi:hypothetical protein